MVEHFLKDWSFPTCRHVSCMQPAGHLSYRPALDLIGPFRLHLVPLPQFLSSCNMSNGRERLFRKESVCLSAVRPACPSTFLFCTSVSSLALAGSERTFVFAGNFEVYSIERALCPFKATLCIASRSSICFSSRNPKEATELTEEPLPVHSKSNIKWNTVICLSWTMRGLQKE
jgi:hypothetical protein